MKNPAQEKLREHYHQLRKLDCATLWAREVAAVNVAAAQERMQLVSVVRAVGVVFSEFGSSDEKERARAWLTALLHDPQEKIRRYAMRALPKLGAGESQEARLLELDATPDATLGAADADEVRRAADVRAATLVLKMIEKVRETLR
jgi:hypothetical protein